MTCNEEHLSVFVHLYEVLSSQDEGNSQICDQSLSLEYSLILQRQTVKLMLKMWTIYQTTCIAFRVYPHIYSLL